MHTNILSTPARFRFSTTCINNKQVTRSASDYLFPMHQPRYKKCTPLLWKDQAELPSNASALQRSQSVPQWRQRKALTQVLVPVSYHTQTIPLICSSQLQLQQGHICGDHKSFPKPDCWASSLNENHTTTQKKNYSWKKPEKDNLLKHSIKLPHLRYEDKDSSNRLYTEKDGHGFIGMVRNSLRSSFNY